MRYQCSKGGGTSCRRTVDGIKRQFLSWELAGSRVRGKSHGYIQAKEKEGAPTVLESADPSLSGCGKDLDLPVPQRDDDFRKGTGKKGGGGKREGDV